MIPRAFLQAWRSVAPWPQLYQVEQDLIISRALCDLFNSSALATRVAFRGGTAINKLLFSRPLRYSEDIDLVQVESEPIGATIDAIRDALSWLGKCRTEHAGHSVHLIYKFQTQSDPNMVLQLKVEINTREHGACLGFIHYPFNVDNPWYSNATQICSYKPEELFATKLRAFLQRRKNRDLFDLYHGLLEISLDIGKVMESFRHYMSEEPRPITRAIAQERMLDKLRRDLTEDIAPLLAEQTTFTKDTALNAFEKIWQDLICRIAGDDWKLASKAVETMRQEGYPSLFLKNPAFKQSS